MPPSDVIIPWFVISTRVRDLGKVVALTDGHGGNPTSQSESLWGRHDRTSGRSDQVVVFRYRTPSCSALPMSRRASERDNMREVWPASFHMRDLGRFR